MLVALDTSTSLTGLALYDQHGPCAECSWDSRRNHTAQILPQLDQLLKHTGVARSDLQAVAVALGPGSWSGLRVGLSIAKGLVLAGGLTLLGIGTLEALAYQHARPGLTTYPLIRLGRDRFATAAFRPGQHRPVRIQPDQNLSLAALKTSIVGPALICGDLDEPVITALHEALGGFIHLPTPAAALRRPSFLAELAWQRFTAGEADDLTTLEPIYLGEPVKAP